MKLVAVERKVLAGLAVAFFAALVVSIALFRNASLVFSSQQWIGPSMTTIEELDDLLQSNFKLNTAWINYQLAPQEERWVRLISLKGSFRLNLLNSKRPRMPAKKSGLISSVGHAKGA